MINIPWEYIPIGLFVICYALYKVTEANDMDVQIIWAGLAYIMSLLCFVVYLILLIVWLFHNVRIT